LRCLHDEEIEITLENAHGGACGGHFNGRSIYGKLIRMGYWWLIMENEYCEHVKKCKQCQKHANLELTHT